MYKDENQIFSLFLMESIYNCELYIITQLYTIPFEMLFFFFHINSSSVSSEYTLQRINYY